MNTDKEQRGKASNKPEVIESRLVFAVELFRTNGGGTFVAHGHNAAPSLFFKRKEAVKYRDELKEHLTAKGKVIKVRFELARVSEPRKERKAHRPRG